MAISVYLDNNVWHFLFARQLDLAAELPRHEFCLCLTREAEFEIPPMPSDIRAFAEATVARCCIPTDIFFGFNDDTLPPQEQRVAGFGIGRWASEEEINFIAQQRRPLTPTKRPSGLYKNEADTSLAARSFRSVVLTLDQKKGPLNNAYKQGGKVVYLTGFDRSGKTLSEYIKAAAALP